MASFTASSYSNFEILPVHTPIQRFIWKLRHGLPFLKSLGNDLLHCGSLKILFASSTDCLTEYELVKGPIYSAFSSSFCKTAEILR